MKFKVNLLVVAVGVVLGCVSSINWLNVPFWVWLLWGGCYLIFDAIGLNDKDVK